MRKTLLAGAAAILLSGTFAMAALADQKDHPGANRAEMTKNFCTDRSARAIGHLAYLEAKLKPTAAQSAAWTKYKDAVTADAKARESDCLARPVKDKKDGRPTILERRAMMEKMLEAKLTSLKATTPALETLYATLSDEQKAVLDHDRDGAMRRFAHWRGEGRNGGMMHHARFDRQRDGGDNGSAE